MLENRPKPSLPRVSAPYERLVRHRAVAAARIDPIALNQEVAGTHLHIGLGAICDVIGCTPGPRALVGVFVTAIVPPRAKLWIACGFHGLVRDDGDHRIGARVAIGAGGLRCTRRRAPIGITHEGVFDGGAAVRARIMPTAVLRAETRGRRDIGRGQHEVDTIGILGQSAAPDRIRHDREDLRIA